MFAVAIWKGNLNKPFQQREGNVLLSLQLILWTIVQRVVWFGNCALDLHYSSARWQGWLGLNLKVQRSKFPSSCCEWWMSHTAAKSRQIDPVYYGSSHISLALSVNNKNTDLLHSMKIFHGCLGSTFKEQIFICESFYNCISLNQSDRKQTERNISSVFVPFIN